MKEEKHIIVCTLKERDVDTEDGGQAKIFSTSLNEDEDNGMFVKVCSWDENNNHDEFNKFIGRKIKITIETIE